MAAGEQRETTRAAIPTGPGVYLLKDARGRVIYVGKARNLRSRLRAYSGSPGVDDPKTAILRSRTAAVDTIVTASETEALVLEANLIKEHRPRYNVRLKDDKRYPFIKVTASEDFPRAHVTRVVPEDGSRYFGPYTDAKAMRRTLRLIRRLFPVRQCPTFRRRPRPCLNAQIGRCLGPCAGGVTRERYAAVVRDLCLFLDGRGQEVLRILGEEMSGAARERNFEEAAALRDRIRDIAKVVEGQRALTAEDVDRDVLAVARRGAHAVGAVVKVRRGKLVACESCPLSVGPETGDDEALEAFVKQFYAIAREIPPEVLVERPLADGETIGAWLEGRAARRVRVASPRRGRKRLLTAFARENAEHALRGVYESAAVPKAVTELGEVLGLSRPPRLIAAVDISNIGGEFAVGTVVALRDGRPDRSLYRRYRTRTVKGADDCAMIREVAARHLARAASGRLERPDLLLVDGGKGQLAAASRALSGAGVRGIALAAIAKREEEVFVPGRAAPVAFPDRSAARGLLQRARDEAHRFSVSYHRLLREAETRRSSLDGVRGVGRARKELLLARFGSAAGVARASERELAEVPGIGPETARRIREALGEARARDRADG
ncbi:MAG: excinuclease ABC subunit UvrC [Candidatus Eisenbacteria bacterium]|nr:excinuclease ABC subunit UvrC [Candidatus Eisenbacteria bacterium]